MLKLFQIIKNILLGLDYDSKHRYEITAEIIKAAEEKRKATGDRDEMIKEGVDID